MIKSQVYCMPFIHIMISSYLLSTNNLIIDATTNLVWQQKYNALKSKSQTVTCCILSIFLCFAFNYGERDKKRKGRNEKGKTFWSYILKHRLRIPKLGWKLILFVRKLLYVHFTPAFWLHNNLCEFLALEQKFKRWFCTKNKLFYSLVLKISGIQKNLTQILYDEFN